MDTIADATDTSTTLVEEPSLRTMTMGVPDHAAVGASVPEVRATTEERFGDLDKENVSHVVMQ
jgi:hypothetical protein